jgi:hypothetical protein
MKRKPYEIILCSVPVTFQLHSAQSSADTNRETDLGKPCRPFVYPVQCTVQLLKKTHLNREMQGPENDPPNVPINRLNLQHSLIPTYRSIELCL